jgi:hypothetical protein
VLVGVRTIISEQLGTELDKVGPSARVDARHAAAAAHPGV